MAEILIENLTFGYPNQNRIILDQLNFSVEEGNMACLCGATGSGKTTLLKMLKREIRPLGQLEGTLLLEGQNLDAYSETELPFLVGYVGQEPEHACITDKVFRELAFGLENMGVSSQEIRRRVAEMAAYFGIDSWFEQKTDTLSGGQKQLLSLACVLLMNPKVLLLDEPTAQLDPISASNFLRTIDKIHKELGITILIVEHRLEEVLPICDQVLVLDAGKIVYDGPVRELQANDVISRALPCGMQVYNACYEKKSRTVPVKENSKMPLTVAETRSFLNLYVREHKELLEKEIFSPKKPDSDLTQRKPALVIKDLWASYEKKGRDVVRGLNLTLNQGEIYCLLGSNGSGKSSAIKAICGLMPYSNDRKKIRKDIGYLPQDVETVFLADSVREDFKIAGIGAEVESEFNNTFISLWNYLDSHPYDLSGGEKQKVALWKLFSMKKDIYLLDEPAKGLDPLAREEFMELLFAMKNSGKAILIVTHDVEFAAKCADRVGLFFRGEIVSEDDTASFFLKNTFFTTQACRATKGILPGVYETCQLVEGIHLSKEFHEMKGIHKSKDSGEE